MAAETALYYAIDEAEYLGAKGVVVNMRLPRI